jgi:hypothetical protein
LGQLPDWLVSTNTRSWELADPQLLTPIRRGVGMHMRRISTRQRVNHIDGRLAVHVA